MDVYFYEVFDEERHQLTRFLPASVQAGFSPQTIQASGDHVPPAALISIRTQSIIPLSWAKQVDGILTRSEGTDHLLRYQQITKTKARLGALSGYCSRAVAEQAVLMMLALFRRLSQQTSQFDVFCRDGITGQEVQGKNALVLGVGKIGREMVQLARGLGMQVKGVDLVRKKIPCFEYVSLQAGIKWADVIFCALPLTSRTKGLLDYALLVKSPKKPVLINVARGEITPISDMIRLLEEKFLGGLALDVFPDEGILADSLRLLIDESPVVQELNRLRMFDNVLCTPHNAFNTQEAVLEKSKQSAAAVKTFLTTGRFPVEAGA